MAIKCPITGCKSSDEWDVEGLIDHFRRIHKAIPTNMKSELTRLVIPYHHVVVNKEECHVMRNPFIIEFKGVHFLMVILCVQEKFYIWMYFLEDGPLSGGRRFYGRITLTPAIHTASAKVSEQNIIYPVTSSAQEIMKRKDILFAIHNKGLIKNFLSCSDNSFRITFTIEELEKKVIPPEIDHVYPVLDENRMGGIDAKDETACYSGTVSKNIDNRQNLASNDNSEDSKISEFITCPNCRFSALEFELIENTEFEISEHTEPKGPEKVEPKEPENFGLKGPVKVEPKMSEKVEPKRSEKVEPKGSEKVGHKEPANVELKAPKHDEPKGSEIVELEAPENAEPKGSENVVPKGPKYGIPKEPANVELKPSENVESSSSTPGEGSNTSKNNYVTVVTGKKKPAIPVASLIKYMDFSGIKLPFSDWELARDDYMKKALRIFFEKQSDKM